MWRWLLPHHRFYFRRKRRQKSGFSIHRMLLILFYFIRKSLPGTSATSLWPELLSYGHSRPQGVLEKGHCQPHQNWGSINKREWILGKQPTNVCHRLLPGFKRRPYFANLLQTFFFQRYKMSQIKLKSNLHLVFFLSTQRELLSLSWCM